MRGKEDHMAKRHEQVSNDEAATRLSSALEALATKYAGDDGFFIASVHRLRMLTGLSASTITSLRKQFVASGVLEECRRRPAHYRLRLPESVTQYDFSQGHPENVPGLSGMTHSVFESLMARMWATKTVSGSSRPPRPPRGRRRQAPEPQNGFDL
jgi:hypothetical protein